VSPGGGIHTNARITMSSHPPSSKEKSARKAVESARRATSPLWAKTSFPFSRTQKSSLAARVACRRHRTVIENLIRNGPRLCRSAFALSTRFGDVGVPSGAMRRASIDVIRRSVAESGPESGATFSDVICVVGRAACESPPARTEPLERPDPLREQASAAMSRTLRFSTIHRVRASEAQCTPHRRSGTRATRP